MWLCHEREGGRGHFLLLLKAHWKLVGKSSSILIAIYLSSESCKTSLPVQVFWLFFLCLLFRMNIWLVFSFSLEKNLKKPFSPILLYPTSYLTCNSLERLFRSYCLPPSRRWCFKNFKTDFPSFQRRMLWNCEGRNSRSPYNSFEMKNKKIKS